MYVLLHIQVYGQQEYSFRNTCPDAWQSSLHFFSQHKKSIERYAHDVGVSARFLYSIVAPEVARYQWMQNRMETSMNKVFYVQYGGGYSNFSIGYFQMKPSFAELLEHIANTSAYVGKNICNYKSRDTLAIRAERVDRLNSVDWQLAYLSTFVLFMQKYHAEYNGLPECERLIAYAHYYNAGLWLSSADLLRLSKSADFPACNFLQNFVYSHIALEMYLTL